MNFRPYKVRPKSYLKEYSPKSDISQTIFKKNKNKLPEGFVRKTSDPYNLYGYTIMQQTLKLQLRN